MKRYHDKIKDMVTNMDQYHDAYYRAETFGGPSLYFHCRSLDTRASEDKRHHLEYVYAMLTSWGMHRMGPGGSKMQDFETFYQSIEPLQHQIAQAQQFALAEMTNQQWSVLKSIFQGIRIMASGTSLVGNSKVMHHMMPNIMPPIDRQYTLRYLYGNKNIINNLDSEWNMMRGIIADFFVPVASDQVLLKSVGRWVASPEAYPWDTSIFKIIDNLIIGARRSTTVTSA